ncbi:MAG: polysaccharide pyruvyl transferase family protein [Lachnospiraceae bacterium]|nr:polysaccharide pyruvyl transferase family protein [Lachnospiraceae bacterium]
MKKIREVPYDFGLVGFWYTQNYGAALTAYALERTVQKMGYSVLMIDAPGTLYGREDTVYDPSSPVRRFISQFCSVSERQESLYDLQKLNDNCNGFLLGSDQLWGWQEGRYHQLGAYYLLDFVNSDRKKVAYGTSFGKTKFVGDAEDKNAFGFLLGRFSDVSVRERDAVTICKESFGCDATWVVDPVFLLGADEYIRIERRSILDEAVLEEDYIFVYLLQPTKEKNRIIRHTAERLSKRVIAVSDLCPDYAKLYPCDNWEFEHYTELEVADWINLIRHAAYVVTDSYHGFCFSIIFRKEFFALTPRGGLNRFQTIAEITGLEDRIDICGRNTIEFENFKSIDYCAVWERLQREVDRSREWLENALKKELKIGSHERMYDMMRYDYLRLKADYERQLLIDRERYFALSSMLRRKSFIERKYIVRTYLVQKLAGRHIAIRGAGVHTIELLKLLGSTDFSILCIWDIKISSPFFEEYPVIKDICELKKYGVDTILLSSWKYRGEMAEDAREQLKKNQMQDIEIIDFYEQLQNEGIPIDSEFYWYDWQLPT